LIFGIKQSKRMLALAAGSGRYPVHDGENAT
jgi:hypothetical protein